MYTKYDFKRTEQRMVYIRPVTVSDLPDDMQEQAEGRDHIYGVHSSEGLCLALVKDRNLAFALARQNDLAPVGVH
ncbi:MAG: DUF1150 family protein [Pseudomonadota bacterium]